MCICSNPRDFLILFIPHVCKLHKAIYVLKQALRAWFAQLDSWLLAYNFNASKANPSLFIPQLGDVLMYLLVYVDDIVIISSKPSAINLLILELGHAFPIKDRGNLSYFLGLGVDHTAQGVLLSQRKYIHNLLLRSKMLHVKPITSPMAASLK